MITGSGHRLGERYVLEERIAVGGMGEVWRGRDEVLNRAVAVKILRLELAPDQAFQARFRAEARTAAGLSHGGIAAVYDYGEAMNSAFLVMELVPGDPLSAMISREGALGTDRTLTIVSQAARALHAAHLHGVVHRDIKPANLMITPELRVKITDFGISRPRDHEPLTATGQVMGTAHYLAPELARGEVASPLSDVYALGVVAYECLAGWRPFEGDNQVEVATAQLTKQPPPLPETVPLPVRRLVGAAMAKNPQARPQGAKAFAIALEDLRLRRLATTQLPSAAGSAWPSDADTPAGGTRLAPRARSGSAAGQPPANDTGFLGSAPAPATPPDQAPSRPALRPAAASAPRMDPLSATQAVSPQGSRPGPDTSVMQTSGKDAGSRKKLLLPAVVAAAVIGVVAAIAVWAGTRDDEGNAQAGPAERPAATASATPSPKPSPSPSQTRGGGGSDQTTLDDPDSLIGLSREEAVAVLRAARVTYELDRVDSDEPAGTVVGISESEPYTVSLSNGSGSGG